MQVSVAVLSVLVIMRVYRSSSFACILLFSTNIIKSDELCEQAQVNCTFLKIGQCRSNSTMEAVSISISCNGCYNDIMFGNISCISDTFQLSKDCYQYNLTHNQTLCTLNTNEESGSTNSAERRLNWDMIVVVLGSLLGITILLLAASIAVLVGFITANMRLKLKLKQFERSHSRLNRHRKEEHTIHNPVYCDTRLKPKEPQKRVHLSNQAGEGKYSLAGPGMPYEIADIHDF